MQGMDETENNQNKIILSETKMTKSLSFPPIYIS